MKTVEEARQALTEARESLREFNKTLTLEQATKMGSGDSTTVEVFALQNTQKMLLEDIIKAEDELHNAKKAEAH